MKASDFKDFCAKAKKIVGKNTIPILDNVLFSGGKILVTDLDITLISSIRGLESLPPFAIDFKDFAQIADKLKDVEISFEVEKSIVKIISKNGKFQLTTVNHEDFPMIPESFEKDVFEYLTIKDIELIKKAVSYVAKDELRPVMNTVYVDEHVVCSDLRRLCFYKREVSKNAFMIPAKVTELIDVKNEIYVFKAPDNLKFINGNQEIVFRKIEGEYPSYKNVIPKDFKSTFSIDANDLNQVLDLAALAANKSSGLVKITSDPLFQTLTISSQDIDFGKSFCQTIDCENTGNEITFGVYIRFLQSILKTEKMKTCNFKLVDPSVAIIINDEVLLVTMMIKD